jgi:peroxygenase
MSDAGKSPHPAPAARAEAMGNNESGAAAVPLLRKPRPERSLLARGHVLRGASFALVTAAAAFLFVLGPGINNDDGAVREPGSSSSSPVADVYGGELTPLQGHAAFFDRDKDGVIYPAETYEGACTFGVLFADLCYLI